MKNVLSLFPFLLLTACSYGPLNFLGVGGGFNEFKLSPDTYIVRYYGSEFTGSVRVYNYALRRAAELTLKDGYSYFKIVSSSSLQKKNSLKEPLTKETKIYKTEPFNPTAKIITTIISGGEAIIAMIPSSVIQIKMYSKPIKDGLHAETILNNFSS